MAVPPVQETEPRFPNTLGSIVTWALFRAVAVVLVAWMVNEYFSMIDYTVWWAVTIMALYGFVIHPAQVQYRLFKENTREIVEDTLCASCRHFDPSAIMCTALDEHVSENHIPCEGNMWEPL